MVTKITSKTHGTFDMYYDAEDHDLIWPYKWNPKRDSKNGRFYAYAYIKKLGKCIFLHNLIMERRGIDHRNGNGLDNRRCNLRIASASQNQFNRITKTGQKGVSLDDRGTYRVRIAVNGKTIHGGQRYRTEADALRRYNELAIILHGQFATLNK